MTEVPEDQVRDLERGADEMEQGLGRLEDDIETAHDRAAEQRQRANPEAAAGDWQDESTAAHQGDDAAEGSRSPGREEGEASGDDEPSGSASLGDVPVHEAEQVEPRDRSDDG